ncbi:MAG: lipase family protein [Bacteroidales bacterium]|jgi:triacylglycerol lipase|nr:lipase family protein [Bacteroidales bacterium]
MLDLKYFTKLLITSFILLLLSSCYSNKILSKNDNSIVKPNSKIVSYNSKIKSELTEDITFSKDLAIQLGKLCKEAYLQYIAHQNGKVWSTPVGYSLLDTIYAVYEGNSIPLGFIAKKKNDVFIVWRGTHDFDEWIQNVKFEQADCSYLGAGVKVELGFDELYTSSNGTKHDSPRDVCINLLKKEENIETLYVTGHSLGGSLAVLNALDLAHNLDLKPVVYTLAGPRTGNHEFVFKYNQLIKNSWRVVNSHDEIPKLPPMSCPPIFHEYHYKHANHEYSITFGNWWNLPHDHSIDNYLKELER